MYKTTLLLLLLVLSVLSFVLLFPVACLSSLVEFILVIQDKLDTQHEVGQWQSQGK